MAVLTRTLGLGAIVLASVVVSPSGLGGNGGSLVEDRIIPDRQLLQLGRFQPVHFEGLFEPDDDPEVACRFIVPDIFSPWVRLQVEGTTTILNPSAIVFRVRSKCVNAGAFRQDIYLKEYATLQHIKLRSDMLPLSFATFDGLGLGDLSRFVDPATGKIVSRIEIWQTGPQSVQFPCFAIDQANWFVTP